MQTYTILLVGLLPMVILSAFLPIVSHAETFTVTTLGEFQTALTTAETNSEDDTLNLMAGSYNVTATLTYNSAEDFSLTISGAGAEASVLDGANTSQILYLFTSGPNADITVQGLTCQNGLTTDNGGGLRVEVESATVTINDVTFLSNTASGTPGITGIGGGLSAYCQDGAIFVTDSLFSDNLVTNTGGGATVSTDRGSVTVTGCTFLNNRIEPAGIWEPGYDGGGLNSVGDSGGDILIENSTFESNTSGDDGGGAFAYLNGLGTITMAGNTFQANHAPLGGGGAFARSNVGGSVTLSDNVFTDNSAGEGQGGGAQVHLNDGSCAVARNSFSRNSTVPAPSEEQFGGGISVYTGSGSVVFDANLFDDNSADENGGAVNIATDTASVEVTNNLFDSNAAGGLGGGINFAVGMVALVQRNNTFYDCAAGAEGGGVAFYSDQPLAALNVMNDILWNTAPSAITNVGSGVVTVTYSDVQGGWVGAGNLDSDPLFVGLGDFHLSSLSPCIGAGQMDADVPLVDIEGNPRPSPPETLPNMGAYELDAAEPSNGGEPDPDGQDPGPTDKIYPAWDVNDDGIVDILDMVLVGTHFGEDYRNLSAIAALTGVGTPSGEALAIQLVPRSQVTGLLAVDIRVEEGVSLYGGSFDLSFDPTVLTVVGIRPGNLLSVDGVPTHWQVSELDEVVGVLHDLTVVRQGSTRGVAEGGVLATVVFKVKDVAAELPMALSHVTLVDANGHLVEGIVKEHVPSRWDFLAPSQTRLLPNYPNPFNPETWIPYQLAAPSPVNLFIYSMSGALVRRIKQGNQEAGFYIGQDQAIYWDGRNSAAEPVPSGVYIVHLRTGDSSLSRKVVLRK